MFYFYSYSEYYWKQNKGIIIEKYLSFVSFCILL